MERQQVRSCLVRWSHYALPLTMTVLGGILIGLALQRPATPVAPPVERAAAQVSSRGSSYAGRHYRLLEEQESAAELARMLGAETPTASFTGTGGPDPTETLPPGPTPTPPRTEVFTYIVEPGDNAWSISQRFGISLDTVIWANERLELDPDLISIGQELYILPVSGVWHTVRAGDTLASIAERYKVTPEKIVGYAPNKLSEPVTLTPGQKLIVPGGEKPFEAYVVYTEGGAMTANARPEPGRFLWPCNGSITTVYSKYHLAIDIANEMNTPLYAADAGTVVQAGPLGTLGNNVQIDHGNGFQTYYGHMNTILVKEGEYVQRGQQIGFMGSTGKSTGPHVHFIIRLYGGAVNPVRYLPK